MPRLVDSPNATIPILRSPDGRNSKFMKLKGRTTACDWLPDPESLPVDFPGMAELRAEHIKRRQYLARSVDELNDVLARFVREDVDRQEALRDAARKGAKAPKDARTPPAERTRAVEEAKEAVWAAAEVLAEFTEKVVASFQEMEPEWLAALKVEAVKAADKRREADRLLNEAIKEEFRLDRLGRWIQGESDNGPLSKAPAPGPAPAPRTFSGVDKNSLERVWHREPHELPKAWGSAYTPPADDAGDDDFPGDSDTSLIEPLDPSVAGVG